MNDVCQFCGDSGGLTNKGDGWRCHDRTSCSIRAAANRSEAEGLRAALQAIYDEVTDESHEDSEDFDEAIDSLMKILDIARTALSAPCASEGEKP